MIQVIMKQEVNMTQPNRSKELEASVKRIKRQLAIREFQQKASKEMLQDARKPEWVKQQEYGDYHYNDFDMEPNIREE